MKTLSPLSLVSLVAVAIGASASAGCASNPPSQATTTTSPNKVTMAGSSRVQIVGPQVTPAETVSSTSEANATASPPASGGLTADQEAARVRVRLLREVEDHYPELIQCFDKGREHDGTLSGRVAVRFTVAPSGDVVKLSDAGGTTMSSKDVVACVQSAFTRMKFSSWDGKAVTAVLPIDFTPPN